MNGTKSKDDAPYLILLALSFFILVVSAMVHEARIGNPAAMCLQEIRKDGGAGTMTVNNSWLTCTHGGTTNQFKIVAVDVQASMITEERVPVRSEK